MRRITQTIPVPRCGQCNKLVDSLSRSDNLRTGEVVFTAMCHGEVEETRLTHKLLMLTEGSVQDSVHGGVAFARPRLTDVIEGDHDIRATGAQVFFPKHGGDE